MPTISFQGGVATNSGMVKAFEETTGKEVKYKITPRRPGDIDACYADPSYAFEKLNWKAEKKSQHQERDKKFSTCRTYQ